MTKGLFIHMRLYAATRMDMATEIGYTDWISAIAAAFACIATFILAIIAWRQSTISSRQTTIIQRQTDIFERQAGYQGQQTTISKQQAGIMEKQTDIYDQQLAIIKDQEADRKNAAMRADLIIASRAEGDKVLDMIIENKGPGWAREIQVYIDGYPLQEYPSEICRLLPGSTAQNEIGPGNKLDFLLEFPGDNPPTNLRIDFSWISDNGMRNSNLGFIIPRQKLEAYKQGWEIPKSIVNNGPRIDAYSKFMELMSIRPINAWYAQYKIVPQLETIQLYSSPEVKRIAEEIHGWARTEMNTMGKSPHLPDFIGRINNGLKPIIKKELEDLQLIQ